MRVVRADPIAAGAGRGRLVVGPPGGRAASAAHVALESAVHALHAAARASHGVARARGPARRRCAEGAPAPRCGHWHCRARGAPPPCHFRRRRSGARGMGWALSRARSRGCCDSERQRALTSLGMQPEACDAGLGRISSAGAAALSETPYDTWDEAMLLLELLPDKPYVLVPSTVAAGVEAPFEIRCAMHVPKRCMCSALVQQRLCGQRRGTPAHLACAPQAAQRRGGGARAATREQVAGAGGCMVRALRGLRPEPVLVQAQPQVRDRA